MSFYKITDPKERRRMFEKLAQTRENVREQFLEDKIGKIESSETLKKFFKPVTESQKEITKGIVEQLVPIKEKVLSTPPTIVPTLSIKDAEEQVERQFMNIGPIAVRNLSKYLNRQMDVDRTFGPYTDKDGTWKIGDKVLEFDGDNIDVGGFKYEGTEGMWELIVSNDPSDEKYDADDLEEYKVLLIQTNAMRQNYDRANPRPKSSKGKKWANVVKNIWLNKERLEEAIKIPEEELVEGTGTKTVVIPSDPNALLERLDL